jgi:hypothetical protein
MCIYNTRMYRASVSPGSVQQIMPISNSFSYNSSLVTWTVICLTAAKFKPLLYNWKWKLKVTLRLTVGQSVSLGVESYLGLMTRYLLLFDSYGLVFVGRPLWREDGSVFYIWCWSSPAQSFSGPSPLNLATIFYCLRFETSFFVASYDSQGHGGGIRPRLHTDCII